MNVRIDPHALERGCGERASADQILDVLETGMPAEARGNRFAKEKLYGYHGLWKGRYYDEKMIKVIYVMEDDTAVTITVVVKYGRWS